MLRNISYLSCLVFVSICCLAQAKPPEIVLYEGDDCVTNNYEGICSVEKQCPHLEATMTRKGLVANNVGHCGYTVYEEIICCPSDNPERPLYKKYFEPTIGVCEVSLWIKRV